MVATFSNPRLAAEPCELMRGCVFADNFVTLSTIANNLGSIVGTGVTADHGLTTDGNGYIDFEAIDHPGTFTAVVRFSATAKSTGYLFMDGKLIPAVYAPGFAIWVDDDGVRATHGRSATADLATVLSVDLDYADGKIHTATYVVDTVAGTHTLYVDELTADTVTEAVGIGTTVPTSIKAGGNGSYDFVGVTNIVRMFDVALDSTEHALYYNDTLTSWWDSPNTKIRCDEFGDDSVGNYIWDATLNLNDLNKGDRVTSSLFPTFVSNKYYFDMADDYVDGWPTWPANFTVNAALSNPFDLFPTVSQTNDTTLTDQLDTSGTYFGYLHNLTIFASTLNQLQLYHAEYKHLYWLERGRAANMYHRLITEGTCKMALFMDGDRGIFSNVAPLRDLGTATLVTRGDPASDGCSFNSATSNLEFDHNTEYNLDEMTLAVYGTFDTAAVISYLVDKGTDYQIHIVAGKITFNGSFTTHTIDNNEHIAVTVKPGYEPRFYVDGEYIGDGDTTVTPVPDGTVVTIGNNNAHVLGSSYPIKQVYLGDKALSDREIKALYQSAQTIGNTIMETGARRNSRRAPAVGAVSESVDPGDHFQLISVHWDFTTVPTTSEDLSIIATNPDGDEHVLLKIDPSTFSDPEYRFTPGQGQGRFINGTTIDLAYTNTDGRTITTNTTYQLDESVTA